MCPRNSKVSLISLIPKLRLYMKKAEKRKQRVPTEEEMADNGEEFIESLMENQ